MAIVISGLTQTEKVAVDVRGAYDRLKPQVDSLLKERLEQGFELPPGMPGEGLHIQCDETSQGYITAALIKGKDGKLDFAQVHSDDNNAIGYRWRPRENRPFIYYTNLADFEAMTDIVVYFVDQQQTAAWQVKDAMKNAATSQEVDNIFNLYKDA